MKRICFLLSIIVLGIVTASAQETITSQEETIFQVVEEQPEFPGGIQAVQRYLFDNIKYPEVSRVNGSQGRVFVRFVIETDGTISNVEVLRSSGDMNLDSEAIRVVSGMPKWKPGTLSGRAVRVYFTLPISFKLSDPVSTDGENETNGAQQ